MMAKKTIMIDGRNLGLEMGTGIATYARNLSYCLHDLGYVVDVLYGNRSAQSMSDIMKEIAFFDGNIGKTPAIYKAINAFKNTVRAPFGFAATHVPITGKVIFDTFRSRLPYFDRIENAPNLFVKAHQVFGVFKRLHKVYFEQRPDLMHWTYPLSLKAPGIPNVYTLHDLVPLRLPYTTLDNKRHYLRLVSAIARTADHIITVSESSKQDIMDLLGVEESRITNTYQSVHIPEKYANKSESIVQREVEGAFRIPFKEYFLFWGSIEPKKNVGRMIEGYLSSGVKAPLVIVGTRAWKSENELKLFTKEIRKKRRIIRLDYVPFSLLVSLIKGAKATVFPSIYEGFGLPVLESMLLGTPVITSNTASIPEISGDAAIKIDPYNPREISQAIIALDNDFGLRLELSQKGRIRAGKFSTSAYMTKLSAVYKCFI